MSLRADLQQMLEARTRGGTRLTWPREPARWHREPHPQYVWRSNSHAGFDHVNQQRLPRTDAQATYHPALNSLYNNLQVIHTSLIELHRTVRKTYELPRPVHPYRWGDLHAPAFPPVGLACRSSRRHWPTESWIS